MPFNSLKPKPPEVSIVSASRTSKSRKQTQKVVPQPPRSPLSYTNQHRRVISKDSNETSAELYVLEGNFPPTKRPSSSYSNRDLANLARKEKEFLNQKRQASDDQHRMEILLRAKEQREQYKLNVYKRNLRSASSDRRPSTAGTVRSDTMDLRRLKQITELESRRLQLLEEAEDRRDVVLKQKEIEKNQLIQKDMYFAEKNEQVSKMRERLQRDVIQARQIIHRQVKEENDKKLYKKLRSKAKRDRRYKDRLVTAKFARSAIAMTRHVNKGIHAKLGLDRRHANVRKVAKIKNQKRQMESLVTQS